jgi:UDP-glucose 4-epimerase
MPGSVLVTGGAGYIGSHTALALLAAGYEVTILDNLSTGFRELVPAAARLIEGDVADQPKVEKILREGAVEAILHFAGSIVVPESVSNPLDYYRNNTENSRCLIAACVSSGIERFVFSSTAAVYGVPAKSPVDEGAITAPINPYGRSKLMTEWVLNDTAVAHGIRFAVLRYFNVAGADPLGRSGQMSRNATHLIKVASQVLAGVRPFIDVFGTDYPTPDGTCVRDFIHVSDLAQAHVLALRAIERDTRDITMNCGYGRGYSVLEVLETMQKVSGRSMDIRIAPRRDGDPPSLVAATDAIRSRLGWIPQHDDLEYICRTAMEWEASLN